MSNNKNILTDRQLEICLLLREGFSAKEVASKLNIAYKTVDNLRSTAYVKIGATKLAHMIKWLYEQKL